MRKIYLLGAGLLLGTIGFSQCPIGTSYLGGNAPASFGDVVQYTTCAYAGEYQQIDMGVTGIDYEVTYTGGASNFVTVYDNTFTPIASGTSPVTFTATYDGTYYSQANLDDGFCSTDFACHTATWEYVGPAPSCLDPSALVSANSTTSSVELSWTENGGATSWIIEYGAPGFTQGSGTDVLAGTNVSFLLNSLPSDNLFEAYVRSICGVGDTSNYVGPVAFNTYNTAPFTFMEFDLECPTGGFMDISTTGVGYDLSDDGEQGIVMDYPMIYQGNVFNEITLGNNGGMVFGTTTGNVGTGGNITTATDGAYPWWDDLDSETGDVFYEVIGAAPNRVTIIQWNNSNNYSNGAGTVTFQVQLHESTNEIYFVYDDKEFGGGEAGDDFAGNGEVGLAGPNQDFFLSDDDQSFLMATSCVRFYYPTCPAVSDIVSSYSSIDSIEVAWTSNGTETNWIIEYGPTGFAPGTGMIHNSISNPDTISGLIDNTVYDFYVYADCGGGDTSSIAGPGTFATDVVCDPVTGLMFEYTSNDTASITWTFGGTEAAWNVEWGASGFVPGMGNGTLTNVTTFPDTTFGLMPGGVYDFYVQADCGAGLNNPWTGPITYVAPIVNDSTCDAITVPVDGSTTVYANVGATTQTGKSVTGFNTVWFEFIAPASGHVEIQTCGNDFDNMLEVYEGTDCSDFGTLNLVDGATGNPFASCPGTFDPAGINLCGLTPGNMYYLVIGSEADGDVGTFPLTLTELPAIEAGTAMPIDVCEDETALDLFTSISGNLTTTGTWYNPIAAPGNELPSTISVVGVPAGTYPLFYVHEEICGSDTVETSMTIVNLPNVGMGGTIDAGCNYESVSLADGLSGTIDFGGTWYDDGGNALSSSLVTFNMEPAGSYDYHYVVDNGVCAADSATVTVTVIDCASLNENDIQVAVYPNPTQNSVSVNLNSGIQAKIELLDLSGKLMISPVISNGDIIDFDLTNFADGIYIIKVTSEDSVREVRIVKQ